MSAQVRPGYKMTEGGVIPEDWECKAIQDLLEARAITSHLDGNHGELYPRSEEFKEYGIPYIGANDFFNGRVDLDNCKFLAKERASLFRKGVARSGDILFAHNATVGPVAKLSTDLDFVILSTTATYFRCNEDLLHNNYLMHFLKSDFFIAQYVPVMSQSTRNQVPITTQRKLCVITPPLKEQRLIAAALSDMDALISGLDQLIAKKRDIKQAAMQQLLTGQQRLPGFSGKWEVKRLRDIFDIFAGGDFEPSNSSAVQDKRHPFPIFSNSVTNAGLYGFCSDSIYPENSITVTARGSVGFANYRDTPYTAIGRVLVLQPKLEINCPFYAEYINNKISFVVESTGVPQLTAPQISKYEIPIPSCVEQAAIATILSDMDSELAILEIRRDKARQIKQGMMQVLLTGRIRIPQREAE